MTGKMRRREFIKISGMAGGLALAGGMGAKSTPSPAAATGTGGVTRTPTYCEMCTFKCAGWVYQRDGAPWKIVGNEEDEHCYGRMCTKGSAGLGSYLDPDRLRKPLIRTEARGRQVFREASWDEALDHVAAGMKRIAAQHGPESVALFTHGSGGSFFKTLLQAFGSDSIAAPSYANCRGPREEAYILTFGEPIDTPERTDMRNSRCLVLLGSHIGENTHSAQVAEFAEAVAKGATVIVADPRFSVAASKAKYWLPIRPGTDMALLLAWIHVVISENLFDRDYVGRYCSGFDQLREAVKDNTPEWAYPITTIRPDIIRRTAREMAAAAPAALVHPGRHVVWYGDDTQRTRAGAILNALLGSWGRRGGFYIPESVDLPAYPHPEFPTPRRTWRDAFPGRFELANLAMSSGICTASMPQTPTASPGASLTYHAWLVYGTNLLLALPNPDETVRAMRNLDLLVVVDTLPAEITGWADVVLPECTYLERYDEVRVSPGRNPQIALRMPAFPPLYESKPAWWMAKRLAEKLGLQRWFAWPNIEAFLDHSLRQVGSSLAEMQKIGLKTLKRQSPLYFAPGQEAAFDTPSGKIELHSPTLAAAGFDPVPRFTAHEQPGEGFYRLLYGRSPAHSFGRTSNNPLLTQVAPENEAWIHPLTAKPWGIENGQYIRLKNQDGKSSGRVRARLTERIRPDCVYMAHGFGHTQKKLRRAYGRGADDSVLMTRVKIDPIMGGQALRHNFVTFETEEQG